MKGKRLTYQRNQTDCVRCSLATLLGRSYRSVPDFWKRFRTSYGQLRAVEKWLNKIGFEMLYCDPRNKPDCLYLANGLVRSAGDIGDHMVVMRKGKVVHDPSRKGHDKRWRPQQCWLVIPKDVGR